MNIEQMDAVIQEYCEEQCGNCDACQIEQLCEEIRGVFYKHPKYCTEAYKILTRNSDHFVNPYWERITEISNRQREKGIRTYGQGLERFVIPDAIKRIEYIQEELIDGLMYLEWLKDILKGDTENGNT